MESKTDASTPMSQQVREWSADPWVTLHSYMPQRCGGEGIQAAEASGNSICGVWMGNQIPACFTHVSSFVQICS